MAGTGTDEICSTHLRSVLPVRVPGKRRDLKHLEEVKNKPNGHMRAVFQIHQILSSSECRVFQTIATRDSYSENFLLGKIVILQFQQQIS